MSDSALNYRPSSESEASVNFEELLQKLDEEFAEMPMGSVERFFFSFDGLDFDIRRVAQDKIHRFVVTATMGYIPFSIESTERREAIKTIVWSSRALPNVRFMVDTASKISAGAVFEMAQVISPDFIFHPLMLFMQEARPFIKLIGKYLYAPTLVPVPPPKEQAKKDQNG